MCLQSTQRSTTTWGYGTISVGFGRMLRAKFLQQFTAHNFCSRRPQRGIEWNQPIHKFVLEKKISNIVKILHWFGFFNFKFKNVLKFLFLCKYFKITWFHCFVSNRKNPNYAKLLSKLPCPKTKSEILKSVRGVSCNCICIFIPCV